MVNRASPSLSQGSGSRSDTPTKRKCRLRVVPNKEDSVKTEEKEVVKSVDRVDIEVENVMHDGKKCEKQNLASLSSHAGVSCDSKITRTEIDLY